MTVSSAPVGEAGVDELKVTVVRADTSSGVPELEVGLDGNVLTEPGGRVFSDLRSRLTYSTSTNSGQVLVLGEGPGQRQEKTGLEGGFDTAVVVDDKRSQNTRTITVDAPFDIIPAGPFSTPEVLEALRGAVAGLVGQVMPSLGSVVSAEVNLHDTEAPARGLRTTSTGVVRVVMRSRPLAA